MSQATTPEPAPQPNDWPTVHDIAASALLQRKAWGVQKYGTPLQPFNGRNALVDAFQEMLDGAAYVQQALIEQGEQLAVVKEVLKFLDWSAAVDPHGKGDRLASELRRVFQIGVEDGQEG